MGEGFKCLVFISNWGLPFVEFMDLVFLLAYQVELPQAIQVSVFVSFVCLVLWFPFADSAQTLLASFCFRYQQLTFCHHVLSATLCGSCILASEVTSFFLFFKVILLLCPQRWHEVGDPRCLSCSWQPGGQQGGRQLPHHSRKVSCFALLGLTPVGRLMHDFTVV